MRRSQRHRFSASEGTALLFYLWRCDLEYRNSLIRTRGDPCTILLRIFDCRRLSEQRQLIKHTGYQRSLSCIHNCKSQIESHHCPLFILNHESDPGHRVSSPELSHSLSTILMGSPGLRFVLATSSGFGSDTSSNVYSLRIVARIVFISIRANRMPMQ